MTRRPPDTIRCFIAAQPPPEVVDYLSSLTASIAQHLDPRIQVDWEPPENYQVTLIFLGEVPRDEIHLVHLALQQALTCLGFAQKIAERPF